MSKEISQDDAKAFRKLVEATTTILGQCVLPDGISQTEAINCLLALLDNQTVYELMNRTEESHPSVIKREWVKGSNGADGTTKTPGHYKWQYTGKNR